MYRTYGTHTIWGEKENETSQAAPQLHDSMTSCPNFFSFGATSARGNTPSPVPLRKIFANTVFFFGQPLDTIAMRNRVIIIEYTSS